MKQGESITITKPGKFQGLTGEIISNNELADKPLTIDLNPFGVWSFKYEDVETIGKQVSAPTNKTVEVIKTESDGVVPSENKKAVKRAYSKRGDKPKEVKVKRAYNRKKVD